MERIPPHEMTPYKVAIGRLERISHWPDGWLKRSEGAAPEGLKMAPEAKARAREIIRQIPQLCPYLMSRMRREGGVSLDFKLPDQRFSVKLDPAGRSRIVPTHVRDMARGMDPLDFLCKLQAEMIAKEASHAHSE